MVEERDIRQSLKARWKVLDRKHRQVQLGTTQVVVLKVQVIMFVVFLREIFSASELESKWNLLIAMTVKKSCALL